MRMLRDGELVKIRCPECGEYTHYDVAEEPDLCGWCGIVFLPGEKNPARDAGLWVNDTLRKRHGRIVDDDA